MNTGTGIFKPLIGDLPLSGQTMVQMAANLWLKAHGSILKTAKNKR